MRIEKHEFYMRLAESIAEASHAERTKVGALLEKDGNIVAFGYNGMPSGFDNKCEYEIPQLDVNSRNNFVLATKPEVLHAESNAIAKCARSSHSSLDTVLYCSYSPCIECAKLIIQAGIKLVVYRHMYRTGEGLLLLSKAGIETKKI